MNITGQVWRVMIYFPICSKREMEVDMKRALFMVGLLVVLSGCATTSMDFQKPRVVDLTGLIAIAEAGQ